MKIKIHDELKIIIPIDPLPTKETQYTIVRGRAWSYTPKDKADYMKACLPHLYQHAGYAKKGELLYAKFVFYKAPPKVHQGKKWLHLAPDTDNLVKPIKDCLGSRRILKDGQNKTMGACVIWDDSQIVYEVSMKFWDSFPRVVLTLGKIQPEGEFSFK